MAPCSKTFTELTKPKLLWRMCIHAHSRSARSSWLLSGMLLQHEYMYKCCKIAQSLSSWNRTSHQKIPRLVTVLSKGLVYYPECVEIVTEEIETPTKKPAKGNCQALKERQFFKRFFIRIFIVFLSLSSCSVSSAVVYPYARAQRIHIHTRAFS